MEKDYALAERILEAVDCYDLDDEDSREKLLDEIAEMIVEEY